MTFARIQVLAMWFLNQPVFLWLPQLDRNRMSILHQSKRKAYFCEGLYFAWYPFYSRALSSKLRQPIQSTGMQFSGTGSLWRISIVTIGNTGFVIQSGLFESLGCRCCLSFNKIPVYLISRIQASLLEADLAVITSNGSGTDFKRYFHPSSPFLL